MYRFAADTRKQRASDATRRERADRLHVITCKCAANLRTWRQVRDTVTFHLTGDCVRMQCSARGGNCSAREPLWRQSSALKLGCTFSPGRANRIHELARREAKQYKRKTQLSVCVRNRPALRSDHLSCARESLNLHSGLPPLRAGQSTRREPERASEKIDGERRPMMRHSMGQNSIRMMNLPPLGR